MVCWSEMVAPAPKLDDLGLGEEGVEFFISVKSFLMVWYCEEVAEARRELASMSWDRVMPQLVAVSAIRLRWPSRACSARLLAWVGGPDAALNTSALGEVWTSGRAVASVIPWSAVAAEALSKTTPRYPVASCSHSSLS